MELKKMNCKMPLTIEEEEEKEEDWEENEEKKFFPLLPADLPFLPHQGWTWEESQVDRLGRVKSLCDKFLGILHDLLVSSRSYCDFYQKQHQEEKTKAQAAALERATVIGGTIVGCVTRLEAIRSVSPFAVIV